MTPSAFFAALTSASGTDANATLRCGVIDRFIDEPRRGERQRARAVASLVRLTARPIERPRLFAAVTIRTGRPRQRGRPRAEQLEVARDVLRLPLGVGAIGDLRPRSGSRSNSDARISTPDAPSINEWCSLHDERVVAVVEALDDPRLPQRLAAGRAGGRDVGDELGELGGPPGAGSAARRRW